MEKSDAQLAEFLAAVERVRRERMGLDEATRQRIAHELGWSDADLQAARAVGEAKREKGRAFLEHGVLGEAVLCLREAEVLLPDDPVVAMLLADALTRQGRLPLARLAALRALEIDPKHDNAFALLADLERRTARRRRARVIAALVALAACAVIAVLSTRPPPPVAPPVVKADPPPLVSSKRWIDGKLACAGSSCSVKIVPEVKGDLPAVALAFADESGLKNDYDGPKVVVAGRIEVTIGNEVEELTADLVQRDANDKELDRIPLRLFPSYEPRLRAGDTYVFHHHERAKPGVDVLQLVPTTVKVSTAPAKYEPAQKLDVRFARPSHFALDGALLSVEHKPYGEQTSLEGVIAVTNVGPNPVRSLTVSVECIDPSGRVADTSDETLAYGHMPPMRAGERRSAKFNCYVRGKLQQTPHLTVKEID